MIAGGGEAGDITNHAAAQRYDAGVTMKTRVDQGIEYGRQRVDGLLRFAVWQDDFANVAASQRRFDFRPIQRGHDLIGNDQHLSRCNGVGEQSRIVE